MLVEGQKITPVIFVNENLCRQNSVPNNKQNGSVCIPRYLRFRLRWGASVFPLRMRFCSNL